MEISLRPPRPEGQDGRADREK